MIRIDLNFCRGTKKTSQSGYRNRGSTGRSKGVQERVVWWPGKSALAAWPYLWVSRWQWRFRFSWWLAARWPLEFSRAVRNVEERMEEENSEAKVRRKKKGTVHRGLWVSPRRRKVTVNPRPLASDEPTLSLATACLACSTEHHLFYPCVQSVHVCVYVVRDQPRGWTRIERGRKRKAGKDGRRANRGTRLKPCHRIIASWIGVYGYSLCVPCYNVNGIRVTSMLLIVVFLSNQRRGRRGRGRILDTPTGCVIARGGVGLVSGNWVGRAWWTLINYPLRFDFSCSLFLIIRTFDEKKKGSCIRGW